ncbi:MAG TPA: universal stress protein [Tepidisphaeraceae bacterium]|jgi:amino acid transporter
MNTSANGREKPFALSLLSGQRPRNVSWLQAAGLLFGDWGTSRLYVLGLAFFFASRTSFWLICAMSLLILAVGWAYTQICRIYPDGGGVYTAAKHKSRTLAVIGALLLFADYTVTASLSALDAFHYYGFPIKHVEPIGSPNSERADTPTGFPPEADAGSHLHVGEVEQKPTLSAAELAEEIRASELFHWDSPGLWAIIAIGLIGLFNLMGPKHTGGFAIGAAVGMVLITFLIVGSALISGNIDWHELPNRIAPLRHSSGQLWIAFVSIVLALSGVEAIANLTGVMKKPVAHTARKAIWVVALEVAVFNVILALFMHNMWPMPHDAHKEDMLRFMSTFYMGPWGGWAVGLIGGTLLLSAANTAITDMISVQYLMARDGELPSVMQKLNRFGVPWIPAIMAASVPIMVLLVSHDLEHLAALYAIGVVGAVAINVTLCATHPRLRRIRRKVPMMLLGVVLLAIWITLAFTKMHALIFVTIVMAVGLSARSLTKWWARRQGERPSLLRQAVMEQLPADAMSKPKLLVGTYGSDGLAPAALREARNAGALLVVCFIREVTLSYKYDSEQKLSIETDQAAQRAFSRFLELGHDAGVPVLPVYDTGPDAAILMAENAAIYGCDRILIGTSRQGAIYHLIKGHFQRRLEALLPPEIPVQVISPTAAVEDESPEPVPSHH